MLIQEGMGMQEKLALLADAAKYDVALSRYKLERYTDLRYERINDYYYSRVKAVKLEELDKFCKVLDCKIEDIIEYKKDK